MRIESTNGLLAQLHQVGTNRNGFTRLYVDSSRPIPTRFSTVEDARSAAATLSRGAGESAIAVIAEAGVWQLSHVFLGLGRVRTPVADLGIHFEQGRMLPMAFNVDGRQHVARFDDIAWRLDRRLDSIVDGGSVVQFGQRSGAWGVDQAGIGRVAN